MLKNELDQAPTFERRSRSLQSTINFIFVGKGLSTLLVDTALISVNPQWTDHCLLSATFDLGLPQWILDSGVRILNWRKTHHSSLR